MSHHIFILLTITTLIHTTTSTLITTICTNTKDPNFCTKILSSSPGGGNSASTKDLELVAVQYMLDAGSETLSYIDKELKNPEAGLDTNMRLALVVCKADYTVMVDYANQAKVNLNNGGRWEAEVDVNWIRRKVDDCVGIVDKEPKLDILPVMNKMVSLYVQIGESVFRNWV